MSDSLVVHFGYHPGTTGVHFAEAAERMGVGTSIPATHRSHLRVAELGDSPYLWIESGVTSLPLDTHRSPVLTAGYLIDVHLHLEQSLHQAALFDVVFVAQRDCVDEVSRIHPQVHWLPLAAPASFLDIPRGRQYQAGFVGNLWRSTSRREIMEAVSRRVTTNDWRRRWSVDDMARIYANSQVVVNPAIRGDLNMRFFEALACGAVVVMPAVGNGMDEIAVEGEDFFTCDFSGDVEVVASEVERVVSLGCSGEHGRALIEAGHTYDHRVRTIRAVLSDSSPSAPVREMTARQHADLLVSLAFDYEDFELLRQALRTSPRGALDNDHRLTTTAVRAGWKRAKEEVKERNPEFAAGLRRRWPVRERIV
jgi:hypothetical protein